jgi:adenylate cyclase
MPKLLAIGPENQQLRRSIRSDRTVWVGRAPSFPDVSSGQGPSKGFELWAVPWDSSISRNHAELRWQQGRLHVEKLEHARNPIFYKGEQLNSFSCPVGDHFVIGETTFRLVEDRVSVSHEEPTPVDVAGYTVAELKKTRYRDADERIEVLTNLPDVLRGASNDEDLFSRLVLLLLEAIPTADAVAIVRVVKAEHERDPAVEIYHWDSRDASTTSFQPSRRLILDAIDHRRHSVRSIWSAAGEQSVDYTISESLDWAFCTPVPGQACAGWGLYVTGRLSSELGGESGMDLRPDVKFTELVANLLAAVRDFQNLQQQQTVLGRFFSPVTLPILSSPEGERALAPRQTEVTVLFCDLRGFSRQAEQSRGDLLGLLHRVSHALDVMTKCIHTHQGVIGDFQGDAALAFWGWPLESEDSVVEACKAALDIRLTFDHAATKSGDPLADFKCGIGIASGLAVAGRLGTAGKFKIDVFGPVVNLASRLEGTTKQLRVPILVDENTVGRVIDSGLERPFRFRRLARLRPYGMEQAVTVSELLPPVGEPEVLSDEHLTQYEAALDKFNEGDWDKAFALLHGIPHWDQGADFLTSHILRHQRQPPSGWDGVIQLESK